MEKERKRLDKIFLSGCQRMQEEVSALLGKTLEISEPETSVLSKEDFFSDLSGKVVFAKVRVEGEVESYGGLLVSVQAAIRIGGTLIMLPDAELESTANTQDYSEELEDSYGEIANIICGSLSSTFEEQFPDNVRLVREEQEVVVPAKVNVESEVPCSDGQYFLATSSLAIGDVQLGNLHLLLPAGPFGLDVQEEKESVQEATSEEVATASGDTGTATENVDETSGGEAISQESQGISSVDESNVPKGLNQNKLDKVFKQGYKRIQDDVSALLGKVLAIGESNFRIVSKEDCFFDLPGKMVFANVDIQGNLEGQGNLLVSLEAAIVIGGTLIMLPDAELENCLSEQEYSDELEDSYGEIANIICGSLTSTFEEHLPDGVVRLVRTEQELVLPLKIDMDSDKPCPNVEYYEVSAPISMDDKSLGNLYFLLPADLFGLVSAKNQVDVAQSAADVGVAGAVVGTGPDESVSEILSGEKPVSDAEFEEAEKRKKKIDQIVAETFKQIESDVGGLLGGKLQLLNHQVTFCDKEVFISGNENEQILAHVEVRGEDEGKAFLVIDKKDAIFMGGTLVMLPETELEQVIADNDFSEDLEDAYGEVANIIAGCYTAVFEEQFNKNIGFTKTMLEAFFPGKVDLESDDTIPLQDYYLSTSDISFDDKEMGKLQLLVPVNVFRLESLLRPRISDIQAVEAAGSDSVQAMRQVPSTSYTPDVLVISDDNDANVIILSELQALGYRPEILHFKDSVYDYLNSEIHCIFLVMSQVSEQGFGVAIKVNSAAPEVPLVLAGPAWTRTLVLKAVKYGADDILITPPTSEDVREKVEAHLAQIAA